MEALQSIGQFFARWLAQLETTFVEKQRYLLLVDGLKNTLIITAGALVIGVVIGSLVAMIKYCGQDSRLLRPLCWLCNVYTTVIRGIPVVVQLLIFYFLILKSSDGLVVGIVTFGINSGAYVAELMRSGIAAVDPGQMEAGRSLGLSRLQSAWHIVLPQAMKNILPAIGNEMIALLKETAVAGYVAVQDLTRAGNLIRNNTYDSFNPLMLVAVVYLVLVIGMTQLLGLLERRLRRSDKR
jgi:His/Glu/Gln/Arg/opine family amino acid ABC transporter permease subunit